MNEELIIDAKDGIVGRVASYAAKQALLGKKIIIVNCNEALVTGNRITTIQEYHLARARGGSSLKGPFYPNIPERIMKRTVRGMLAYTQQRGLDALKRVMCYNTTPEEYKTSKKITFVRKLKSNATRLSEVGKVM